MNTSQLRYPTLRRNLESAASCFADRQFQADIWSNSSVRTPAGRWDLVEAFEFIVDDLGSADLPGLIGEVLVDEQELALYSELRRDLLAVAALARSGGRLRYDEFAGTREWSRATNSAAQLVRAMAIADRHNGEDCR